MLDDGDETFFLLGMEAAEADDMVEETEFDESFLSMTPRAAQPSVVVADRGVPWDVGDVGDVGDADVLRPKPIVYSGAGAGAREVEVIVPESRWIVSSKISTQVSFASGWENAVSVSSPSADRFVGVLVMKLKLLCSPRAGLMDDWQRVTASRKRWNSNKSPSGS